MTAKPNLAPCDPPEAPVSAAQWRAPTLDVARLDRAKDGRYVVKLPDGEEHVAELSPDVSPQLAEECLRQERPMLVRQHSDGLVLVGALQTQPSPLREQGGVVTLSGRDIQIEADRRFDVEVGPTRLTLERSGKLSLLGERLTMHIASLIKLIASKVELP